MLRVFGLPVDVVAARYLYDLVERAFETETALFRTGPTYAGTPTGLRRTATNSFAIGLGRSIVAKLATLRQAREVALRGASGRDLVVAKDGVVEAELAALGLHLRARTRSGARRVLRDVYEQGHEAGLGFDGVAAWFSRSRLADRCAILSFRSPHALRSCARLTPSRPELDTHRL